MEYVNKIVEFVEYCHKCEYENTSSDFNPCSECLANPTNVHSQKPVNFKKKKHKKKGTK